MSLASPVFFCRLAAILPRMIFSSSALLFFVLRSEGVGFLLHRGAGGLAHRSSSRAESTARKAAWGTFTLPMVFMRFLPAFCFSSSLRLRDTSPP